MVYSIETSSHKFFSYTFKRTIDGLHYQLLEVSCVCYVTYSKCHWIPSIEVSILVKATLCDFVIFYFIQSKTMIYCVTCIIFYLIG